MKSSPADTKTVEGFDKFSQLFLEGKWVDRSWESVKINQDKEFVRQYLQDIEDIPVGSWNGHLIEVLENPIVKKFVYDPFTETKWLSYYIIRAQCEKYIQENSEKSKQTILKEIENNIITLKESAFPRAGNKLPQEFIDTINSLRKIFVNDEMLAKVFINHLPLSQEEFESLPMGPISSWQKGKKEERENTVKKFFERNNHHSPEYLLQKINNIQRMQRAKIRQKEEQCRIAECFPNKVIQGQKIENFGAPYKPQKCSAALAERIYKVSHQIKFMNHIRHSTRNTALESIFNDGLYGNKTLMMQRMQFTKAALQQSDIRFGDANVICFGADYGFFDARGDVEITLDFAKLNLGKTGTHCAFFKQRDLGYTHTAIRSVDLNSDEVIYFDHTSSSIQFHRWDFVYMRFQLQNKSTTFSGSYEFYAPVPNYQLISYDIQNIDAVLILNVFRFVDNLIPYRYNVPITNYDEEVKKFQANLYHEVDESTENSKQLISNIYHAIENMTDDELSKFLRTMGIKASQTMEFNFFGAHQIDFDTLVKIKDEKHEMIMADFILSLQQGDVSALLKVKDQFPTIFQSYRFIDYLSTKTENKEILSLLSTWRCSCKTPGWYPMNDKLKNIKEKECKIYSESDTQRINNSVLSPKS